MPETSDDSVLCFEDVSLSFAGQTALERVSFDVRAGSTRVIFGAAGSGKSVLLKLALGLLKPDSGSLYLFGKETTHLTEEEYFPLRSRMGVLFQEGGLFDSMTIEENVSYPLVNQKVGADKQPKPEEVETRVREALRFVELEDTLPKFPSQLSGGMRRRVGIARAAVTEPPLILYDSPTAGLDPITANTIIALIIKKRDTKNTTSAIVTHRYQDGHMLANYRHDPDTGQLVGAEDDPSVHASTVFMVFREGKLVFEGTQEELEAHKDPYVSKFKAVKT